jgi:hypothetical protein
VPPYVGKTVRNIEEIFKEYGEENLYPRYGHYSHPTSSSYLSFVRVERILGYFIKYFGRKAPVGWDSNCGSEK